MKRDWILVRLICKKIEDTPAGITLKNPSFQGYDQATVDEHIRLASELDLIDIRNNTAANFAPNGFEILRLTNLGHDFLARANDAVWQKVLPAITNKSLGFDDLLELLEENEVDD